MPTNRRSSVATRNGSANAGNGRGARRRSPNPRLGVTGPELQKFGTLRLLRAPAGVLARLVGEHLSAPPAAVGIEEVCERSTDRSCERK